MKNSTLNRKEQEMTTNKIIDHVTSANEIKAILEKHIKPTDTCIVHTSLSAFGYIPGGEYEIVKMLKELVAQGNIVMAAQTNDLSDPSEWGEPPATVAAQKKIRVTILPFNVEKTPIHMIGRTPEYFRTSGGVKRSNHPLYSMCAWGKDAEAICNINSYDMPFGADGPLGKAYDLDAKVVMLGTDYESCTALHLADSTINRPLLEERAPIADEHGQAKWISFRNVDELDKYDDFNEFGDYFESKFASAVHKVKIYNGYIRVIPMKKLVDAARAYYLEKDRLNG